MPAHPVREAAVSPVANSNDVVVYREEEACRDTPGRQIDCAAVNSIGSRPVRVHAAFARRTTTEMHSGPGLADVAVGQGPEVDNQVRTGDA